MEHFGCHWYTRSNFKLMCYDRTIQLELRVDRILSMLISESSLCLSLFSGFDYFQFLICFVLFCCLVG